MSDSSTARAAALNSSRGTVGGFRDAKRPFGIMKLTPTLSLNSECKYATAAYAAGDATKHCLVKRNAGLAKALKDAGEGELSKLIGPATPNLTVVPC